MTNRHPWRTVLSDPEPVVYSGRGSVLGPDTSRRTRWYEMTLDCGHVAERTVRYRKREERFPVTRSLSDVLPPPKRVRCQDCPVEETP